MLTTFKNSNFPSFNSEEMTSFLSMNYKGILEQIDASEKTIKKYKSDAFLFISFLEGDRFDIDTFRRYKKYLKQIDTISTKTKNCKLIAAKVLLKELFAKGLLKIDLTTNVKNFRIRQDHVKDGFTKEEVSPINGQIDKENDNFKRSRLQAIFTLLAFQGLRQFEVVSLKVEDLKLQDNCLFVLGKGRDDKERIDLHPKTKNALENYLKESGKKSGFLFTSLSNNSKGKQITTRGLRKTFNAIFKASGVFEKTLHGFRHFFVTTFLEITNGDILTTQKFSRHKSLQAVKMYDDRKKKKELLPTFYAAF